MPGRLSVKLFVSSGLKCKRPVGTVFPLRSKAVILEEWGVREARKL
jgi:hypothetical protein